MVAQEVISCISANECVVMTSARYYWSIAFFALAVVLLILLILFIWRTPAWTFFKAWISGNPIMYITNRSQGGRFTVAKTKYEGLLDVAKSGPYILTENSHTIERRSGRPLFFAFGEFAATLPLWWISVINTIRSKFSKDKEAISNIEDVGKKIGMEFNENKGAWVRKTAETGNQDLTVKSYMSIKLHDLVHMFPFNITPALIESRLAHEIAKKQKMWNSMAFNISAIAVLLVAGAVAAIILWKFMGGGVPEVKVTIDQAGQVLMTNYTG
jgi:hypothetical protein